MPRLNTQISASQSSTSSSRTNPDGHNTGSLASINTTAPSSSRVSASQPTNQNPEPYMPKVKESPTLEKTMTVSTRQRNAKSKLLQFSIKPNWPGVTQLKPFSQLSKKTGFNNFLTTAWLSILTLSNYQELEAAIKDILPTDSELLDDIKKFKESGNFGGLLGKKGNLEELLEFKNISIALLKQLAEQSSDVEYSEQINHEIETLKNEGTSEALLFALHDCFNKSCSYFHKTTAPLQILTVIENNNHPVMDESTSLYISQKADIVLTKTPLIVNVSGVYGLHYHQTNENEKAPDYAPAPIIPEESQAESPTENSPVSANTPTTPLVRNASITYIENPVANRLLENPDNRRLYGGRDVSSKSYSSVQHMIQCTSEELKTELPHLSPKQWKISPYGQNDVVCSGFLSIFSQLKPADIRNKLNILLDSHYPYHDTAFEEVFNAVVQTASHFNKKNIQTGGATKAYNVAEHLGGLSLYESTNLRRAFDLIIAHFPLKEIPVSYTQDECITDEHLRLSQTINKLNPTYPLLALHAFFDVSLTLSMHHPKTDNAILIRFDNSFKNMPFEDRPSSRFQAVPHIRVQFVESARQNTLPMEISFTPAQKQVDEANAIANINRQNANNQVQLGTVHTSELDQHIEQMHRPSFYICCNLNASISIGFKSRPQTYIATAIQSQFTHAIGFKPIESDNSLQANLDAMAQKGQALLQFSNKIQKNAHAFNTSDDESWDLLPEETYAFKLKLTDEQISRVLTTLNKDVPGLFQHENLPLANVGNYASNHLTGQYEQPNAAEKVEYSKTFTDIDFIKLVLEMAGVEKSKIQAMFPDVLTPIKDYLATQGKSIHQILADVHLAEDKPVRSIIKNQSQLMFMLLRAMRKSDNDYAKPFHKLAPIKAYDVLLQQDEWLVIFTGTASTDNRQARSHQLKQQREALKQQPDNQFYFTPQALNNLDIDMAMGPARTLVEQLQALSAAFESSGSGVALLSHIQNSLEAEHQNQLDSLGTINVDAMLPDKFKDSRIALTPLLEQIQDNYLFLKGEYTNAILEANRSFRQELAQISENVAKRNAITKLTHRRRINNANERLGYKMISMKMTMQDQQPVVLNLTQDFQNDLKAANKKIIDKFQNLSSNIDFISNDILVNPIQIIADRLLKALGPNNKNLESYYQLAFTSMDNLHQNFIMTPFVEQLHIQHQKLGKIYQALENKLNLDDIKAAPKIDATDVNIRQHIDSFAKAILNFQTTLIQTIVQDNLLRSLDDTALAKELQDALGVEPHKALHSNVLGIPNN